MSFFKRKSLQRNSAAWDLFNRCFKTNEKVFVIDDKDNIYWGRLGLQDSDTFTLTRSGGICVELHWWDMRWMSHDGFPVRKLYGADGSQSIESEDSVMDIIRQAHGQGGIYRNDLEAARAHIDVLKDDVRRLTGDVVAEPPVHTTTTPSESQASRSARGGVSFESGTRPSSRPISRGRFGDPFDFEDVVASELHNAGKVGWEHFLTFEEECLVLHAKGGAIAHLWDLPTVHTVEFGQGKQLARDVAL